MIKHFPSHLTAIRLTILAVVLLSPGAKAATNRVFIDPSLPWNGFENVYYQNGDVWTNNYFAPGTAGVVQGTIDSSGTVTCAPDIRMDQDFHLDTNAWADASGTSTGICSVLSTFYLDSTTVATNGDTVIFSGTLVANTLVPPYSNSIVAFVKDFDSSWGYHGMASLNLNTLTNGQSFTVSKTIAATGAGNHVQWGFEWSGPPARSNTVASLGKAVLSPFPAARGASVPWVTYEAENMTVYGATTLGRQFSPNLAPSEASGRKCVRLGATGHYVQFTARSNATAIVVRCSVPDTADGVGADYTLGLYKNGILVGRLPLTSRYSWLYGSYPYTNRPSAGLPRNFFDEVRTNGVSISTGDVVKLQKDSADTASYYDIDLVDLESVPAPLNSPSNSLSISDYGGVGDGGTDCTTALRNCIAAAQVQGKAVWMPAGTYLITGNINLPSNTTLQGAGMWHTTLIGSASLYNTTPSRRINLNGNGSNIHLADFAILGFLNYRNDSEGNDGLGGAYGVGSSISRLWVEHTKAGAWILNSSGLVVDGCRFRNTLADGININRGMRGTIVRNCTARGTGDDGFAIWPSPGSQTYAQGLNVISHCTAEATFLANGGAIYGGDSNRIEDCLFQDTTYGCGVLISTTFPVGSNVFSGTTVVQRSDLVRCGGYDGGFSWRAALQICLQTSGLSGLNLNNLNITNSASDGLSIIYGAGALSHAIMSEVKIPDYGLGIAGRHALWARNDAVGTLIVSNSIVPEYLDSSPNFAFSFFPSSILMTVQASPAGRSFAVDGVTYASAQTFSWTAGSPHSIGTTSPQTAAPGMQYLWNSWSDGGAIAHTVSPINGGTYTANFTLIQTRILSLAGDLAFDDVLVGSNRLQSLIISNAGNSLLTVSGISCPEGFSANWSGQVSAGSATNAAVKFQPGSPTNYSGNLVVNSDATSGASTIPVSGNGVAASPPGFNRLEPPLLMEGGELILAYRGLPGNHYALERATRLGDPIDWIVVSTNVAATNGMLFLTNYFFDLENYFRIRQAGGP